jgi:hypothetical protein
MRHPFQVSIVANGNTIIVAKRSTRERADDQATAIRDAIGNYNRDGVPAVTVTDLRETPAPDND